MSDNEANDMLAAEYVLGTLDVSERADVDARRSTDQQLDEAIRFWENRLSPLLLTVASQIPPPHLFNRIEGKLDNVTARGANSVTATELDDLRRGLRRWRLTGIMAMAACICLAVGIGLREAWRPQPETTFVAVFQQGDAAPAFLMSIDLNSRTLSVRSVSAQRPSEKSYQLWIVSAQLGGRPRSLGVLDDASLAAQASLPYDADLLQHATFGVSLEPRGGSQTGQPTGPVLHAKLIPAAP